MNDKHSPVDISVCIANYNGGSLVLDCLASVYSQEGDFTLEVIVHDDRSSDDSLQSIREHFPGARTITSDSNVGFCISNNRMAAVAQGRYLLLLNNDAILRPGSLAALMGSAKREHRDCVLGLPQFSMSDGTLIDRGYRMDPFLNPIPMRASGTHDAGVATGACVWIPRCVWQAVDGFPPWFESVAEDIFLCTAARLLGYRVVILDAPGFDHWVGRNLGGGKVVDNQLRTTARRRRLSERNKTFVMLCCYPWPALILLLPLHFSFLVAEALFLLLAGTNTGSVRQIYGDLASGLWRQRTEVRILRRRLMRQRPSARPSIFSFTDWVPFKLQMLLAHGRPKIE